MSFRRAATTGWSSLWMLLVVAWLSVPVSLSAQVIPVPADPPRPAAKSDTAASDSGKAAPAQQQAAGSSKPDPIREAWEKLRSWSLIDFITWARLHGVSVVAILLVSWIILWLAGRLQKRLIALWGGYPTRGSAAEQENRARTLVGVLHNAVRTAVIATATLMVLQEIGVPIGALLGGVAVAGLAVAFGAQSLIKDYFTGFLVLLEQQYMIGDVVRISGITGQVEQITLRVTLLRDLEGAAHFIPHGQINMVSNLTHGWSQAVFDLNVPCGEPVERIHDLFFELAGELRRDAGFGKMILNDPQMMGVESLGDTTYTIKFALKTLPLKRWEVKRELLKRIRERFQNEKIKVVVPA